MKPKFDMSEVVADIKKEFKDQKTAAKIGTGSDLRGLTADNFIAMPEWWVEATDGVPGLPFGKIVMIAGDSDSGKTSACIDAMKAAQAQDVAIIYVETEGKTTEKDLLDGGVNPKGVMIIQESIAEKAFDLLFIGWDKVRAKYPGCKILVIVDSIGNVVSQRDANIKLSESSQKPGGKGTINRLALNKMVAKRDEGDTAILVINYTYDNIGSPGKTNAGGKAVNFFSCLTFQTSRKGWVEKQVKGKKVRVGAMVTWKLFKNHLNRSGAKTKEVTLSITSDGIKCVGSSDSE